MNWELRSPNLRLRAASPGRQGGDPEQVRVAAGDVDRLGADREAELAETEDRAAYARQYYNDTVFRYNTKIQSFPANALASQFRFTEREYFEVDDAARGNVEVDLQSAPRVDLGGEGTPPAAPPAS